MGETRSVMGFAHQFGVLNLQLESVDWKEEEYERGKIK
jgi:hypothetical protein